MKTKLMVFLLILGISMAVLSSCLESEQQEVKHCAKCGREATHTLSGPAEIMKSSGIDLSKCTNIMNNIYSADLCDNCDDIPVATLKPDPYYIK